MVSQRKHVRFNFAENEPPPKPPRCFYSPIFYKVEEEPDEKKVTSGESPQNNNISHAPKTLSRNKDSPFAAYFGGNNQFQRLPTSKTFPMDDEKDLDFGDDFVPKTYASVQKEWESEDSQTKPQVRRMSLKEFTGLENPQSKFSVSPLLARLHRTSLSATHSGGNLLDKFCSRRRSSSLLSRGLLSDLTEGNEPPVTNRFGNLSPKIIPNGRIVHEPLNFTEINQRINEVRSRLSTTLNNMPNESPRKRQTVGIEKEKMMEELSLLASGCKNMVRVTTMHSSSKEKWQGSVLDTVDCADKVSEYAEILLRKSNSLYQAQLMTSKVDQMLRALIDTVNDMQKAYDGEQYGQEAKQLVRSSTTLAATLNQLIQAVQTL
jgi:hypothetical protein